MKVYGCAKGDLFDTMANKYGEEMYFQAENVSVSAYNDRVYITDLENAMKSGKECKTWAFVCDLNSELWIGEYIEMATDADSLSELVAFLREGKEVKEVDGLKVYCRESKGIRTFTPFVMVKPIKKPEKWTLSNVWKGILSGQITEGKIDGIYTDDYAMDAALNFRQGEMSTEGLKEFAKKLIENPSGWSAWSTEEDKDFPGRVKIHVSCHTFDMRTLYAKF